MVTRAEFWSGRVGFVLANIAAAVGLGSIWKFPYEVGSNGGGAFVLFYLLGVAVIVLPLMFVELALGRAGRSDAIGSLRTVAALHRATPRWRLVAAVGVVAGFLILSFYSVIGGWALAYVVDIAQSGLQTGDALMSSPAKLTAYHSLFMAATAFIVARGIAGGVERAAKILMPLLVVLLVVMTGYAAVEGEFTRAVRFLFACSLSMPTTSMHASPWRRLASASSPSAWGCA
jgi:NSS family neurotransmitter:Na+ symporter